MPEATQALPKAPPIEGPSAHTLTEEAATLARATIEEAGGVEVFFIGRRGEDGLIHELESHAYGSEGAVPVLMQLARPGEVILHNHPSGNLAPSEADLIIASRVGDLGCGSYIINNDASRVRVVVRPHDAVKKTPVSVTGVERLLGPNSALAEILGDYEDRPQQRDMARAVCNAFNNDGIAVIEAGTGTGKSLAYLVPAMVYALQNKERIVVSTRTINLQEQILHKDLPLVAQALERDIKAELVKGRSNYVCKRKAQSAREELATGQALLIEDEFRTELRETLDWAKDSQTGDISDLPVPPRSEVWERVVSESDNCLRVRCPFYEECFFYNSRRRAARADVLVVNHSLLMSDLSVRRESGNWSGAAVLPPYRRVILDEAHHMEEVATGHLGFQIVRQSLSRLFTRLYRRDTKARRGVFAGLSDKLEELTTRGTLNASSTLPNLLAVHLLPSVADVRHQADKLLEDFGYAFLGATQTRRPAGTQEVKIRLVPELLNTSGWHQECRPLLQSLAKELAEFTDINRQALEALGKLDEELREQLTHLALEWTALVDRLEHQRALILQFLSEDVWNCRWVEIALDRRQQLIVRLCMAPISVAGVLRTTLHERVKSAVYTSATLTVDESFTFFLERNGLRPESVDVATAEWGEVDAEAVDEASLAAEGNLPDLRTPSATAVARPIETLQLGTPFDYERQVYFGVPTDLGGPKSPDFERRLAEFIVQSCEASDGRAFVLFTSYGQMQRVHGLAAPGISRLGYRVLLQGMESRDRLLQRFREDETSVLFATSSFWEGVDVKGRALELLILAKLPFAVPDDPVQEAQWEWLERQGRDPFSELAVPRAIIRLKQGFGRLIRSSSDRGAVMICDDRIVRATYGQRFLRSLPEMHLDCAPGSEVVDRMRHFFRGVYDEVPF